MMIKGVLVILLLMLIFGGGVYFKENKNSSDNTVPPKIDDSTFEVAPYSQNTNIIDFDNQTYKIDTDLLFFKNGKYAMSEPKTSTHSAVILDKQDNADGTSAAAIISDNPGGSGTFYYLVGGMLVDGKFNYSKLVLLGDRIKFNKLMVDDPGEHDNGIITVEYLDRGLNDPMATPPTKQMLKKFSFEDNGNLIEVLH